MNTIVHSHFDQPRPTSPIFSMDHCDYQRGFCNNKEGAALVWNADSNQKCGLESYGMYIRKLTRRRRGAREGHRDDSSWVVFGGNSEIL
ncbi:unnamed protein product [Caenorhabditis nigoni]